MEIVIGVDGDRYYRELRDKKNGNKRIRRTHNFEVIQSTIANLPTHPRRVEIVKNDVRIIYNSRESLIVKDFRRHVNTELYYQIFEGIHESVPIIKKKTTNKKLLSIVLSSAIVLGTISGIVISNQAAVDDSYKNATETVSIGVHEIEKVKSFPFEFEANDTVEPITIDLSNFDLLTRLEQTKGLVSGDLENCDSIPIATQMTEYATNKIVKFMNSSIGEYCFSCANDFGVDPYLNVAILMGESSLDHEGTLPGGTNYNGFAVGISQLESPNGQKITAYNYSLDRQETVYETMENAEDIQKNIKMGIMRVQNILNKYDNNIYLALQSYNYGSGLMDLIVAIYADEVGVSKEEVIKNYQDTGWMKYVKLVHENPQKFVQNPNIDWSKYTDYNATIEYLANWQYGKYGNDKYIEKVLSYYIGTYSKNRIDSDKIMYVNLTTMEQMIENIKENTEIKTK